MVGDPQALAALQRARSRISMNGWGQGGAKPGKRGASPPFTGWCLEEAVRGRAIRQTDDSEQSYAPGEEEALGLLELAIAELHPAELDQIEQQDPAPPSKVVAWNDAAGRSRSEVMAVLDRARQLA